MSKVCICRNGADIELTPEEIERIYRVKDFQYKLADVKNKIADRQDCKELTELDISVITNIFDDELTKSDLYFDAYWGKLDYVISEYLKDNFTEDENPDDNPNFGVYWIPLHNAKVVKRGLEENKAPFLPNNYGIIKTNPIYNLFTGYCLPAGRLIPAQFAKMENEYKSNIVIPKTGLLGTPYELKENMLGVFFSFKDEEGEFHTNTLYFPEQITNGDKLVKEMKDNIVEDEILKDTSMVIASSEPREYLGSYIAACRSGMKLCANPDIVEEFKAKLMVVVENQIKDTKYKDKNIPSLSNVLFEADKRATEIIRVLTSERGYIK